MAKRNIKRHWEKTQFSKRWGIRAVDLAKQEGVTTDAIHMREMLYGSPFQRKSKPTYWEKKYGYSLYELAEMFDMHPQSVATRDVRLGNIYATPIRKNAKKLDYSWKRIGKYKNLPWLHPLHPDHDAWRAGKLFDTIKIPTDFQFKV